MNASNQKILERIGFMQGRLSALVDGKIQAFPWNEWRDEFPRAKAIGLTRMEWTIDQDRLRENPLATEAGRREIIALCKQNALRIPSLTGDCFMQAPFWKATGDAQKALVDDLDLLLDASSTVGIEFVLRSEPQAKIWCGAIDDELTAKGYIVPGLGDAGDLAFGSKVQM